MAIPKPEPRDWQLANAQELLATDREVLAMLRAAKKRVDTILADLPAGKQEIKRAQLEQTRARLLAEQATIFERLGDIVSARRARSASRSSGLSAAANEALLRAVGMGAQGQFLYKSSLEVSQRAIDAAMARMKLSALPLSRRIYNTSVWMGGRLGKLINETLATGLDAREFAKRARDWFNPNTPGGVRYAAMRLARTEINNAFHAMTAEKAANDPWINEVEWNLSKSHPKPDICNEVNADSPYPADRVPARPHPQCMCYITPKPIDEDEFIDRFVAGEYDDFLDKELEAAGWKEEHPEPPPPVAINSGPPSQSGPEPLRGDEAMASVPKGLFKRGSMKPKQRDALKIYESGWFIVIQNRLREQRVGTDLDDSINKKDDATIGLIDEAMEGSALPSDVEVWRGMFNARTVFGDRLDGDLTGMTWHDRGYGSTTTEEKITDLFITGTYETGAPPVPDSVKMKVLVKAGTKALATSNKDKGSKANGGQAEITLQHDTDWRIVQDNGVDENGVRNLVVEVQPHVERTESGQPDEGQDRTGTDDRAPEGQPGGGPEGTRFDRSLRDLLGREEVLAPEAKEFAKRLEYVDEKTGIIVTVSDAGLSTPEIGQRAIDMAFDFTDRDGNRIGGSDREFTLKDGEIQVEHQYMRLNKGFQGAGFASRWNARNEEIYRAWGVVAIHLEANINVGGFAWARAGYDFESDNNARKIGNALEREIESVPPELQDAAQDLIDRSRGNGKRPLPLEFAMLGWTEGATMWFGKQFLLNKSWNGVKLL